MRLIDADALKEAIPETDICIGENCRDCGLMEREQILDLIDDAPTIDRPTRSQFKRMAAKLGYEAVIHCRDCLHYCECVCDYHAAAVCAEWFCWNGERKADEQ